MASFRHGSPDLGRQRLNDRASSLFNNTDDTWCVYDGHGYTGDHLPEYPRRSSDVYGDWDNTFSSLRRGEC
ncbi:hypothetical protein FHS43_002988 [Streptosporangium becharense]|uniref:Uncharacterized protein n=2 Tax=Streptosporangium becharense TaxID=1816182 RepID=A0A7W9IKQ2_9ACTN|nr:hypothetical protein [Streptosporangium becharense]MBB5822467.1 hypothetical protein [Streptosporangium becharense]